MKQLKQTFKPNFPVGDLTPHPDNPNSGDVDGLCESIDELGFFGAVLVQKTGSRIVAGEHRWRAAIDSKAETIPVLLVDIDDTTALKIMLRDNKSRDESTWIEDVLEGVLSELSDEGKNPDGLAGSGFDADDLGFLGLTDDGEDDDLDDTVPLPAEPVTYEKISQVHWLVSADPEEVGEVQEALAQIEDLPGITVRQSMN